VAVRGAGGSWSRWTRGCAITAVRVRSSFRVHNKLDPAAGKDGGRGVSQKKKQLHLAQETTAQQTAGCPKVATD
jgi:hypothetical protein